MDDGGRIPGGHAHWTREGVSLFGAAANAPAPVKGSARQNPGIKGDGDDPQGITQAIDNRGYRLVGDVSGTATETTGAARGSSGLTLEGIISSSNYGGTIAAVQEVRMVAQSCASVSSALVVISVVADATYRVIGRRDARAR
jgi:hypothetical protein